MTIDLQRFVLMVEKASKETNVAAACGISGQQLSQFIGEYVLMLSSVVKAAKAMEGKNERQRILRERS